ncbi:pentapeptide repeat-containing protein [Proteus columbae]|uniref:pentapeptide repeat-containing protein n=1 Tax=Proteus columbae TaxID=1987580 RepID=UPI00288B5070|nr:pentapeptide repeat-containing protein [Proteus columbae]
MNNLFMYLKVKIKQDAILAIDLAEKSPSIRNFNLANKILTVKLTSEKLKLQKNPDNTSLIQEKIKNYESLFLKLNEIKIEYACEYKFIVVLKSLLTNKKIKNSPQKKIIGNYKNRVGIYRSTNKDVNVNHFINKDLMDFLFENKKINNDKFNSFNIKNVNINDANMCGSQFKECNINESIFADCELTRSHFHSSTIKNSTFNHCNLINTDFLFSNIENVNFINSDLSNATIKVKSANFENSTLDNTKIEFDINNIPLMKNKKTLFETISSINDKYDAIKTSLMSALILKIQRNILYNYNDHDGHDRYNIGLSAEFIIENIFSNQYFCKNEIIKKFVTDILYSKYFDDECSNSIDKLSPDFLSFHLDLIDHYDNDKMKSFMLENNDQFIKLMVLSLYHENQNVRDRARALYDKYLNLKEIKSFVQENDIDCGDRKVDWYDKNSFNYILSNKNKDKKIVINHEDIVNVLFDNNIENNTSWTRFYLYINNDCQGINNIDYYELFNGFKILETSTIPDFVIFKNSYNKMANKIESNKWLSLFKSSGFYEQFHSVLIGMKPLSNEKLINIQEQEKLSEVFKPFLNALDGNIKKSSLTIEHYQKLCELFDITLENNALKSQYLLSLSTLIVKYSSSSVFGTDSDSPEILRMYAYALMSKANELNPKLMEKNFKEWSDRLLGMNEMFQCTDVLFSIMSDYGKEHFKDIFYKIIPLHWR